MPVLNGHHYFAIYYRELWERRFCVHCITHTVNSLKLLFAKQSAFSLTCCVRVCVLFFPSYFMGAWVWSLSYFGHVFLFGKQQLQFRCITHKKYINLIDSSVSFFSQKTNKKLQIINFVCTVWSIILLNQVTSVELESNKSSQIQLLLHIFTYRTKSIANTHTQRKKTDNFVRKFYCIQTNENWEYVKIVCLLKSVHF